jgi:hypothetical protein
MAGASPGGGWMQGGELTIRAARGAPPASTSLLPLPPPNLTFCCVGVVIGSAAWVTVSPPAWWNQTAPASIYVDDAAGASFGTFILTF